MGALTHLWLPTLPHPLPSAHPLMHVIDVITVAVKQATENPAVLAS